MSAYRDWGTPRNAVTMQISATWLLCDGVPAGQHRGCPNNHVPLRGVTAQEVRELAQ